MTSALHPGTFTIEAIQARFGGEQYIADRELATAIFLRLSLGRPLLLEGEAGVGKTEVARVLATVLGAELIRLQCYEGIDVNTAVYEWDYPRQMLEIRLLEARGEAKAAGTKNIFSEEFLIRRPLLRAIVTSNRTREIHDALKRRCLYQWIDYPSAERELAILLARQPGVPAVLARAVVGFVQRLRQADLTKLPGVAETLDWAAALMALGAQRLEEGQVGETLGVLLKYREDVAAMRRCVEWRGRSWTGAVGRGSARACGN